MRLVLNARIPCAAMAGLLACLLINAGWLSAATHSPANSQALIDVLAGVTNPALQLGDTIILDAAKTYAAPSGGFVLRDLGPGTNWVTIQSSNLSSLPAAGQRVKPSDAANMPNIVSPSLSTALRTVLPPNVAHHYKLVGLEIIGPADNSALNNALVEIGVNDITQNDLQKVPHDIVIDRCYLHENSDTQAMKRNIGAHGKDVSIINCYITGGRTIYNSGTEGQCIWGNNGPGPYNITNNFLQGAGENIMFGGAAAYITGVTPTDIIVQGNHFYKPLSWMGGTPHWGVKNHFELKCGKNVTLDGNIFENCWSDIGQQWGTSVTFKCIQGSGGNGSSWFTTENITVSNNIIRHVGIALSTGGNKDAGGNYIGGYPIGLTFRNNLIYDVDFTWGVGKSIIFNLGDQGPNMTIDHNTGFQYGRIALAFESGADFPNFTYTNNMMQRSTYQYGGFTGSGFSEGKTTLSNYFPGCIYKKNVSMGSASTWYLNEYPGDWNLPPHNNALLAFPTSWGPCPIAPNGVLVNQGDPTPEANNYAGWKVVTGSAYDNSGTDGKDIGCDIDAVVAATSGCISGVWSGGGGSGLIAYDGFNYTGNLNGQNGGSGFANAWTAVSGQGNPALSSGSLSYIGGPNELTTTGNKLAPTATNQSVRNFASPINAANSTKWVSFRVKRTVAGSLPTNHVGFPLYPSTGGGGTSIFLGKPGNASNWGVDIGGTQSNVSGTANIDAFLLYKLVFTSTPSPQVTVSMWVDPGLASESSLGTSHITPLTVSHGGVLNSMKMSTGTNSTSYQLDEFRIGGSFADVTPGTQVEVIVDNPAATTTGTWTTSTWTGGGQFEGTNYLHDGNAGKGSKTCRWTPTVPATGSYEVFAKWTSNTDRTIAAPYAIQHAGGTANVTKNQQSQGGTWVSLGIWTFNSGTGGYVQLSNGGTTGYVIADAVRFVKQ